MRKAKKGDSVKVHFTGRLEDGTLVDTSVDGEPVRFTIGANQVIRGLEEAVEGMAVGEKKTVTLPPEKAYGEHRRENVLQVDRSLFPENAAPEVGQLVDYTLADGKVVKTLVADINGDNVTLDPNHPLAGKRIEFDVELVDIVSDE